MSSHIICPHCHSLIDPLMLETAVSATARYQVCPECDSPIILFTDSADDGPADARLSDAPQAEIQLAQVAA